MQPGVFVKARSVVFVGLLALLLLCFTAFFLVFKSGDSTLIKSETLSEACHPVLGDATAVTIDELKRQGLRLGRCIDKTYEQLAMTNSLRSRRGIGSRSIDATVTPFFSVGLSFDAAAIVLKSAGFSIAEPGKGPINSPYYSCLTGGKTVGASLGFATKAGIQACPKIEGVISSGVGQITAQINTSEL